MMSLILTPELAHTILWLGLPELVDPYKGMIPRGQGCPNEGSSSLF